MSRKEEYEKLLAEIHKHDYHYYIACRPQIPDREYDQLVAKLAALERKHPEMISPTSPTQRVADKPTIAFNHLPHKEPMLSLANTYKEREVSDFIRRIARWSDKFCCEPKVDGVAISLYYARGKLDYALTRGDGNVGDEVTANIQTIRSLPLQLRQEFSLEVRGEVFMPVERFAILNSERKKRGEETFANPRNAAAGSLKLLDPQEVAKRPLALICYACEGLGKSQLELIGKLRDLGLPTFAKEHIRECKSLQEVLDYADYLSKGRSSLPFAIDGIVLKVDDLDIQRKLGNTASHPRWAVAYKFKAERVETKLERIELQVGRSGIVTPRAHLSSVSLAGTSITSATLHNFQDITKKDLREGDHVILEKGGEVIPKVVTPVLSKRVEGSKPWIMPEVCPSCGSPLVPSQSGFYCSQLENCQERRIRLLTHYASKQAMDIEHLGPANARLLIESGLVSKPSDLYQLTKEVLIPLPRFQSTSAKQLISAIEKGKNRPLSRLLVALSIPHVGKALAQQLAKAGSIEDMRSWNSEKFRELEGIGSAVAESLVQFFADKTQQRELDRLLAAGIKGLREWKERDILAGKWILFTGTLQKMRREEAQQQIEARGGKVANTISSKLDYVVIGENPGQKGAKAKKRGLHCLSEEEWLALIGD